MLNVLPIREKKYGSQSLVNWFFTAPSDAETDSSLGRQYLQELQ